MYNVPVQFVEVKSIVMCTKLSVWHLLSNQ
jgi:hypothetical protein